MMDEMDTDLAKIRSYIDDLAESKTTQLPPEPKLAEILDFSRGRLRTLLKKLEADGLIWRHVGKGTFVGPRTPDYVSDNRQVGVSLGDIMDARQLLEPTLAALAAINATRADVQALERAVYDMRQATIFVQWKRMDDRIHRLIAEATHNSLLVLLYDTVRPPGGSNLDMRIETIFGKNVAPGETTDQHDAIVQAISAGDPARAEAEMRAHLLNVRQLLFGVR